MLGLVAAFGLRPVFIYIRVDRIWQIANISPYYFFNMEVDMNDRDYWHVVHIKADCHYAVISPLGVTFHRYPDCYQAHARAAEMNGHMLGIHQHESDILRPIAFRSQDEETREAYRKLMEDLAQDTWREDDEDDAIT